MSNLQWQHTEPQPDVPDIGRLWRGVMYGLLIEGCVLLVLAPIFYGLGWLG